MRVLILWGPRKTFLDGMAVMVGVGTRSVFACPEAHGGSGLQRVDLRDMLERARDYREDVVEGRWVITTSHQQKPWEVIVEPDYEDKRLIVVTAYWID